MSERGIHPKILCTKGVKGGLYIAVDSIDCILPKQGDAKKSVITTAYLPEGYEALESSDVLGEKWSDCLWTSDDLLDIEWVTDE
jgi:hypothetical protein